MSYSLKVLPAAPAEATRPQGAEGVCKYAQHWNPLVGSPSIDAAETINQVAENIYWRPRCHDILELVAVP